MARHLHSLQYHSNAGMVTLTKRPHARRALAYVPQLPLRRLRLRHHWQIQRSPQPAGRAPRQRCPTHHG
eukprot:5595822-Alexandrium_andersonii.AAC.1